MYGTHDRETILVPYLIFFLCVVSISLHLTTLFVLFFSLLVLIKQNDALSTHVFSLKNCSKSIIEKSGLNYATCHGNSRQ